MIYRLLADTLVIVHFGFIVFVLAGGLLLLYKRWLIWLHMPSVVWAILLEFNSWICPLTPMENHFRVLAGEGGYAGGFVEHYLIPLIYPQSLTPVTQVVLGMIVLLVNVVIYVYVIRRARGRTQ